MYRALKVQLQPTAEQEAQFEAFANNARFVYNKTLDWHNMNWAQGGKFIGRYEMRDRFVELKHMLALFGEEWLKEVNADIIVQSVSIGVNCM
jgi:transposase